MGKPFDPKKPLSESSSYDEELGGVARKKWPLGPETKPKRRGKFKGETVEGGIKGSKDLPWDSWVWHPEKEDWLAHGSSIYPGKNKFGKERQVVKHPEHGTYWKTISGELSQGNAITYDEDTNRYYSNPGGWSARMMKTSDSPLKKKVIDSYKKSKKR